MNFMRFKNKKGYKIEFSFPSPYKFEDIQSIIEDLTCNHEFELDNDDGSNEFWGKYIAEEQKRLKQSEKAKKMQQSKENWEKIWNKPTCPYQQHIVNSNGTRAIRCSIPLGPNNGHMLCPLWNKDNCPQFIKETNPELYEQMKKEEQEAELLQFEE
jgi:hypothetical protein